MAIDDYNEKKAKDRIAAEKELLELLKENGKAEKDLLKVNQAKINLLSQTNENVKTYLDLERRRQALQEVGRDLTADEVNQLQNAEAALSDQEKALIDNTRALEDNVRATNNLNAATGAVGKTIGASAVLVNQLTKGHLSLFTSINGVLDKTIEMAFSISDLNASLARQTGQVTALSDNFHYMRNSSAASILTFKEMEEALVGLNNQFGDFVFLGETVQREIQDVTARMVGFGASVDSTTKAFDFFGTTINQSPREAIRTMETLKGLTMVVGQGVETIFKDLQALRDPLTRYGAQSKRQFIELKTLARSLNLETKAIFDIAEGFDTFESAAQRAMALNAQFGTQLNSAFIMSLEHNERILAVRSEFQRLGLDVNNFNRRELQMLAGGLQTSEEQAKRLLDTRRSLSQIQKDEADENRRMQDYLGATKRIQQAIQILLTENADAIVAFIDGLANVIGNVATLSKETSALGNMIKGVITGFLSLPFVSLVVKTIGTITNFIATSTSKFAQFLTKIANNPLIKLFGKLAGGALVVKDMIQASGYMNEGIFGYGAADQALAQKRLAAGGVGALAGAGVGASGAGIGAIPGAIFGYGIGREAPGAMEYMTSDNKLPPGKETIVVNQGPKLDDFFLTQDGTLYPMNEGDMVLGGTNLLGQQGGMNNNQKMVVKELTVPLTLKVGTKEFVAGIAMATDVIFDPTTVA